MTAHNQEVVVFCHLKTTYNIALDKDNCLMKNRRSCCHGNNIRMYVRVTEVSRGSVEIKEEYCNNKMTFCLRLRKWDGGAQLASRSAGMSGCWRMK